MNRAARGAAVALAVLSVGCSGDAADGGSDGGVRVVDAWTRPSPATVTDAAIYVTVESGGGVDDEVVAVGGERCVTVVPHVTTFDDEGIATMGSAGDALQLPAGGSIEMEPNGLHLMCLGLDAPLTEGDTFTVDLEFAEAGVVVARVAVEDR